MLDVGNRLRDERKRLGLNQEEFALAGGVTRRAQTTYESGRRVPDARYLSAVARLGVDVQYVLTGARAVAVESNLSPDERALLDNYRHSHREDQAALRRMGLAMSKPTPSKRNGTTGGE
nr:helix-turn-helix transcriptional regulator [Pandoraea faecigallinarum]